MAQKALYESSLGVTLTPIGLRENRLQVRGTKGAEVLEEILVTASKSSRSYHDKSVDYLHVAAPKNAPASFDEIVYSAQIYVDFSVVPDNTD